MDRLYYKPGTWNAICDRCGVKFKSDELIKTWEGFMVCKEDFEVRHIADFIKAPKPITAIPFTRPEGTDVSVGPTYVDTGNNTIPTGNSGNGSTL